MAIFHSEVRLSNIDMAAMTLNRLANIQVGVGAASVVVGILLIFGPGSVLFAAYEQSIAIAVAGEGAIVGTNRALVHWLLATCGAGVVG